MKSRVYTGAEYVKGMTGALGEEGEERGDQAKAQFRGPTDACTWLR